MAKILTAYTSAKQFLEDGAKHGLYIKMPLGYHLPTNAWKSFFKIGEKSYEYSDLLTGNITWLDGAPCGVMIDDGND